RWGNFLEVSIARVADKPGEPQRTHSIAISIPDMTTMKLTPGHEPDRGGTLRYRWSERPVSGAASGDHLVSLGSSTLSNSSGPDPKLTADELDILPSFPKVPTRAFVDEPAKPAQCYSTSLTSTNCSSNVVVMTSWSGYGDRTLSLKTEGYPRPSEDDAIELPKVGMRIYAPAGMGRGVYEQIMLATAKDRAAP
ncbi:MAG TPA: hypothetical protein VMR25_12510, partial [Planctomycetaceae bacterium]|nr:hypothetical protein [Planctomycetaceae bacterium]